MSRSIEQRLNELESSERSLKTALPITGSLVQFVVTESQYFRVTIQPNDNATVKFKFTPDKNLGKNNLITLAAETVDTEYPCTYYVSPQSGDGIVMLTVTIPAYYMETLTTDIKLTALGTTSGSFAKVG